IDSSKPTCRQNRCCKNGSDHRFRFLKRPLTDVSIPTGARWIPKGMSVEYLAKAKGNVRAVADGSAVDWASAGDKLVEVTALNEEDQAVFTARITMNVKLA
ncbi:MULTISPECIES: DUF4442 domain-containing protein, partial [Enterobacteriaceae]